MGQAKNRGTFEQRQTEAMEREAEQAAERALVAAARDAIARKRRAMINATPAGSRLSLASLIIGALVMATTTTTGARDDAAGY